MKPRAPLTCLSLVPCGALTASAAQGLITELDRPDTTIGYLSRLLINETAFPGERGHVSQADTKGAMLAIL
jgi:hypothetical protein